MLDCPAMQTVRNRFPARTAILAALLAVGLAGCEQFRSVTGQVKQAPDEFQVVSRAPLSLPPDYGLRPPQPGSVRPQEGSVPEQAKRTIVQAAGRSGDARVGDGHSSAAEVALLRAAGATGADPEIRRTVDRESAALIESDRSFTDRLVFWRDPDPPGKVVDPEREARRLREAQALGRPISEGETPVIKRRERGFLEGIF